MAQEAPTNPAADRALAWQQYWARYRTSLLDETDPLLRAAHRVACDHGFVLTRARAVECGLSEADVRRLVRSGRWTGVAHGVVSTFRDDTDGFEAERRRHAVRSAAAVLVRQGHVITGRSAAVVHALPTLRLPSVPETACMRPATSGNRSTRHVFSGRSRPDEIGTWFGAPVHGVPRTVVDLARHDRRDGLIAADSALAAGLVTRDELEAQLRRASGWPGVRRARQVIALASPLSESPLESLTRLAVHDFGLPAPELQVEVWDPDEGRWYRVDMMWRDCGLVLEADGRDKYTDDALWREKRRELALNRLGYRVERVVWSDLTSGRTRTRERLRALLASPLS